MQFASLPFLLFFLVVLSLYWLNTKRPILQKWVLLLSSYAFYTVPFYQQSGWKPLSLLILSTTCLYLFESLIHISSPKNKHIALATGVSIQLGILGLHKYYHFFRESTLEIAHALGIEAHLPLLNIVFPVGISFYCFQAIAHLVDLKRGHAKPINSFLNIALFQAFFPKLLLGPICRSADLIPQLEHPRKHILNVHQAIILILLGLFKKVILATYLYESGVSNAFFDPESQSALGLWSACFGYTAQLYCDFSGYTDMARGIALLFGYTLPKNFSSPYAATNLGDFWKRWHMSFSQWLRDYIYLPLGGSRKSPLRVSINLFLTFLFCGIWHGASWGYIIWGGLHGIGLALHKRERDRMRAQGINPNTPKNFIQSFGGWLYMIGFVALSRIVFQCPDLEHAWLYYKRMFNPAATGETISVMMILCITITLCLNIWGEVILSRLKSYFSPTQTIPSFPTILKHTILITIVLYVLFSCMPNGIPPYLYARF